MWRLLKNVFSYLTYVFSLDWWQLVSASIDILILGWSVFNWKEVAMQPSLILIFIGVLVNFVWQLFNVSSHFSFLRKEDPREPLMSLLNKENGGPDYSAIHIENELITQDLPYVPNYEMGILENPSIDALMSDKSIIILPVWSKSKQKSTKEYIKQYKHTLLKFLNHKWFDVTQKGGKFTNDAKICLASEIYRMEDGSYQWRVNKGCYYDGQLTNFIFSQYVGGTHYSLYPPMSMLNTSIKPLGNSDFSDHIGVSTLLYTSDNYVFVARQAANTGYNPNKYMPSGSGSLDFGDFHDGDDIRSMVIRGAERELREETSLKKSLTYDEFRSIATTTVLGYYRDMERGGKPEFCCVTRIKKPYSYIHEYIQPESNEIATKGLTPVKFADETKWSDVYLPGASLSLRMCYVYMKRTLIEEE